MVTKSRSQKYIFSIGILLSLACLVQAQSAIPQSNPMTATASTTGQPLFTFVDQTTGQLYGRYITYETVPVAGYQYQEVTEKQWVPEWVTENKLTTETSYVPMVSYQLQLRTAPSTNPFSAPKQYWQYVPVVQYQTNNVQKSQPITYQRYVEKEVKKAVPVFVTKQEQRPTFADRPMNSNTSTTAMASAPSTAFPTRPLDSTLVQSQIQPAPTPYYSSAPAGYNPSLASYAAYNPYGMGGVQGRPPSVVQPAYPASSATQFVNNPTPNAGLAYMPTGASYPVTAAYPAPNLWSSIMYRTGSLFPSGWTGAPATTNTYVASNGMSSTPTYQTGYPSDTAAVSSYNGISFSPSSSPSSFGTQGAAPSTWSVSPVNDYRDPSQTGIPASVLR